MLAATALWMAVAFPSRGAEADADPAAGQLLIASAGMQDPRFHHSVILLLRHDQSGAFGVVINHPLVEQPLSKLLAEAGGKGNGDAADKSIEGTIQVFLGGPVQPQYGFVIPGGDYRRPETLRLENGIAMTATKEVLRDIGHHRGPEKYLFALGYSGWGAGQLEGEIARHDWFTAPADPEHVFDADRSQVWERALARRTREL